MMILSSAALSFLIFLFFAFGLMATEVIEPCAMTKIEAARTAMQQIINSMDLLPVAPVHSFRVNASTLRGRLGVVNSRSLCPGSARRAPRQFCPEAMRLDVDLSREPAVVFESECSPSLQRNRLPCGMKDPLRRFVCDSEETVTFARRHLCTKVDGRTVFEEIREVFLRVPVGCALRCLRPACRD